MMLLSQPGDALFAVTAGVVLLLFVGIHNAWDISPSSPWAPPTNRRARKPSRDPAAWLSEA